MIGDFSGVRAIASSYERVYVVYGTGVGIWLPMQRRWQVPRAAPDPLALARVHAAVIDPLDQSLWLGGEDGLLHFEPVVDRWDRMATVGRVTGFGLDPADPTGVWVRTSAGWMLQPRIGPPVVRAPPATMRPVPGLEDAYRDVPALRALAGSIAMAPGLGAGRLTAAAPSPDGSGWFVGTDHRGVLQVDRVGARAAPLPFGLVGELVGAVAVVAGAVWVATDDDARGNRAALMQLDEELAHTTPLPGDPVFGLGVDGIRRIVPGDRVLWLATDRGVLRVSLEDGAVERWDEGRGLQDQRVHTAAWWQGGLLVGTARGVAQIDRIGELVRPAPNLVDPVYALHPMRDTAWIGTARGLATLVSGDSVARPVTAWRGDIGGRGAVFGIGQVGDTLVAMMRDGTVWRDPLTSAWYPGPPLGNTTGVLRGFFASSNGVWIGGDRGAALLSATGVVRASLRVGSDVPDAVTAIAASEQYLWVGTWRGVVRVRLR